MGEVELMLDRQRFGPADHRPQTPCQADEEDTHWLILKLKSDTLRCSSNSKPEKWHVGTHERLALMIDRKHWFVWLLLWSTHTTKSVLPKAFLKLSLVLHLPSEHKKGAQSRTEMMIHGNGKGTQKIQSDDESNLRVWKEWYGCGKSWMFSKGDKG